MVRPPGSTVSPTDGRLVVSPPNRRGAARRALLDEVIRRNPTPNLGSLAAIGVRVGYRHQRGSTLISVAVRQPSKGTIKFGRPTRMKLFLVPNALT
jgi:hypothetical protein